jgi:hypothetical protein
MPRQRDEIWSKFKEIYKAGVTRAECRNCRNDIAPLVKRMKQHKCTDTAPPASAATTSAATTSAATTSAANPIVIGNENAPPAEKKFKQGTLEVIRTGPVKQREIDLQFTR